MVNALVVEDDLDSAQMLAKLASIHGFSVTTAATLSDARRSLDRIRPDVLLLDMQLPDGNGLRLLEDGAIGPHTGVILLTGHASLESSIEAMRMGARDYLVKPVNGERLRRILADFRQPRQMVSGRLQQLPAPVRLLAESSAMREVARHIERVAPTSVPVFNIGESGTGKEVAASAIHAASRRSAQPFLALNCSALSPQLIETELFGHERGSFTGADRLHLGFFERADGGTLFLDEVTEMPVQVQAKMLRVLESGTFHRVGSTEQRRADVRIVAASNRKVEEAVADGSLRADLFYRLHAFPLHLPPLRERPDDIAPLARLFLHQISEREGIARTLTSEGEECLLLHRWAGNARELKNVIQRAYVLSTGEELDPQFLRPAGLGMGMAAPPAAAHLIAPGMSIAQAERLLIVSTLEQCRGQREQAAGLLGISLKTLYNKLKINGG